MNKNKLYFKFILNFTFKKIILKKETNNIKKHFTNIYFLFFRLGFEGATRDNEECHFKGIPERFTNFMLHFMKHYQCKFISENHLIIVLL